MSEVLVTTDGVTWFWYLVSEYNNHVLAQGTAKTQKTALKHGQQALYAYLETVEV